MLDWSLALKNPAEVIIADEAAVQAAQNSLGRDVRTLGYKLVNPRVSILNDLKIVRFDIQDHNTDEAIGIVIRIETDEEVEEGIKLY